MSPRLTVVRRVVVAAAAPAVAAAAGAQSVRVDVRVDVRDSVSGAPLAQALVSLRDSAGRDVREGLTTIAGVRVLAAPAPGRYTVHVRRVGQRPFAGPRVTLGAGETLPLRLLVPRAPIALAAVEVRERTVCRTAAAPEVVALWEAARTALAVSAATAADASPLAVEFVREYSPRGALMDSSSVPLGTAAGGRRAFASAPPESLAADGYVAGTLRDGARFHAPDERVLLSESFAATHCFAPARGGGPDGRWLGVRFTPAPGRAVAEVAGTVWLDSATAEPRRMDFAYVWREVPAHVRGLGGRMQFGRLPSGEFAVTEWAIRLPHLRVTAGYRLEVVGYRERGGELLLAAAAPNGVVARVPSGGVVRGLVYDSVANRPLAGARLTVAGAPDEASADSAGRFVLTGVPPGRQVVSASHPALAAAGLGTLDAAVGVRAGGESEVLLATPGRASLWRGVCGREPPNATAAIAFGTVRDARSRAPVGGAVAEVRWATPAAVRRLAEAADSAGAYRVCGFPADAGAALRAVAGAHASPWARLAAGDAAIRRVDLLVDREARGVAGARLATVEVRADAARQNALLDAVRRRQRIGQSDVADSTVWARTGQFRTALAALPFVEVRGGVGAADWRVVLPGRPGLRAANQDRCVARVFIDGRETSWQDAQDLAPDQVAAVELFRRAERIPTEYGGTSTLVVSAYDQQASRDDPGGTVRACGAVFFWSRAVP